MPAKLLYLDASGLVKLVVAEAESAALADLAERWPRRVSSRIASVEVGRVVQRASGPPALASRANDVMSGIALVEFDASIAQSAAGLDPPTLRALDAIHIASALSLGRDVGAFVTYDARQQQAAQAAGLQVLAPG